MARPLTSHADLAPEHLLRTSLYLGRSNYGKTETALTHLCAVVAAFPDVPVLILDGGHTLSRRFLDAAALRADLRARVIAAPFTTENRHGFGVDLAALRPGETVHERTAILIDALAFMREDSGIFSKVHDVGEALFACIVAAGRPITDVAALTYFDEESYRRWLRLRAAIRASGRHEDPYVAECVATIDSAMSPTNRSWTSDQLASTRHNFLPVVRGLRTYATQPAVDLEAHFDAGGVVVCDFNMDSSRTDAMAKRLLFATAVAYARRRTTGRPFLVVLDESRGHTLGVYLEYIATARNADAAFWYIAQSSDQIGPNGSLFKTFLSVAQNVYMHRPEDRVQAEHLAFHLHRSALTATVLSAVGDVSEEVATHELLYLQPHPDAEPPSTVAGILALARPIGQSDRALSRVTTNEVRERVSIAEQEAALARTTLDFAPGDCACFCNGYLPAVLRFPLPLRYDPGATRPWLAAQARLLRSRWVTRPPLEPVAATPAAPPKKSPPAPKHPGRRSGTSR